MIWLENNEKWLSRSRGQISSSAMMYAQVNGQSLSVSPSSCTLRDTSTGHSLKNINHCCSCQNYQIDREKVKDQSLAKLRFISSNKCAIQANRVQGYTQDDSYTFALPSTTLLKRTRKYKKLISRALLTLWGAHFFIYSIIKTLLFLGSLITNLRSDLQNSRWRIQDGGRNFEKSTDLHKNRYKGVFGVADHESEVRFRKFKMADPRWWS